MCGTSLRDIFEDLFSKMMRDIATTRREIERQFELFDISPLFGIPKGKGISRGFSIQIRTETGKEPEISVKSWGWPKAEKKEVESQLGRFGLKEVGEERAELRAKPQKHLPIPKVTEEPKTEVRRLDSKVVVEMELPGVKSQEDINITELEQSVEVKAMAGEKAYFKIITKPTQFRLANYKFEKGKLRLEFM